jgi:hypothetical protein
MFFTSGFVWGNYLRISREIILDTLIQALAVKRISTAMRESKLLV